MPKKITFYCEAQIIAGAESYLSNLINHLDESKYDVSIIFGTELTRDVFLKKFPCSLNSKNIYVLSKSVLSHSFTKIKEKNIFIFQVIRPFLSQAKIFIISIKMMIQMTRFLKNKKIDIFHINNGGYPGGDGARISVLAGKLIGIKKILMTVHNLSIPLKKSYIIDKVIDKLVFKNTDSIICVSNAVKKSLEVDRNAPSEKLHVLYNGIPDYKLPKDESFYKEFYNLPKDKKLIGMVASFEERKGHKYLIEAFRKLSETRNDVALVFVGDYLEGNGIEIVELIKKYKLESNTYFCGFLNRPIEVIFCLEILVLTSIEYESFGLVLVEAMSQRKCIVATNVGGIPEVVVDGVNGFIVPPRDSETLLKSIVTLMDNNDLRIKMGLNGRKRFEEKFNIIEMVNKLERFY